MIEQPNMCIDTISEIDRKKEKEKDYACNVYTDYGDLTEVIRCRLNYLRFIFLTPIRILDTNQYKHTHTVCFYVCSAIQ